MTRRLRHGQAGLSLLELLVAFAIMALSVGLLYRSMGSSARTAGDLVAQQRATLVAESVLALRDSVGPDGWNESGVSADLRWQVSSRLHTSHAPLELGVAPPTPVERMPLYDIQLVVSWGDGARSHQLEVATLLPQRKPLPGEAKP